MKMEKKNERIIIMKTEGGTITRCMQFWESAHHSTASTLTNLQPMLLKMTLITYFAYYFFIFLLVTIIQIVNIFVVFFHFPSRNGIVASADGLQMVVSYFYQLGFWCRQWIEKN